MEFDEWWAIEWKREGVVSGHPQTIARNAWNAAISEAASVAASFDRMGPDNCIDPMTIWDSINVLAAYR